MQLESATESQMSRRRRTSGNLSSSCHQTPARQRPIATATAQNLSDLALPIRSDGWTHQSDRHRPIRTRSRGPQEHNDSFNRIGSDQ